MASSPSPTAIYTASAVVATSLVAAILWRRTRKNNNNNKADRSWSYTSRAMALGSFPPSTDFPDPIINAVLLFDDCPSKEDIAKHCVSKMLAYNRLSSVYDPATGKGQPCENLDPLDLVREISFQGGEKELFDLVEQHMHAPLSQGVRGQVLPWWEFLILRSKNTSNTSAVVWRSHHALADGMSMVHIAEDIITDMEGNPVTNILPQSMKKKFKIQRSFLDTVWGLMKAVGSFAYMLTGPCDDETAFSKRSLVHSNKRCVVRFAPIPLSFIKELKNAAGVSVNDVLYTCVSQAIHDYLLEQDDATLKSKGADLLCRTLMPIALPPGNKKKEKSTILRNKWCFLSADYAVGIDDIEDRLSHVHRSLTLLKQSLLPGVIMFSQNYIAPHLPIPQARHQVADLMSRHSTVFSNVPGPPFSCKLAGKEVTGAQMVFSNLVPQIGLLSYRGNVYGNFCMEEMKDSHRLPILMSRALVTLAERLHVDTDVPASLRKHAAA